MTDDLDLSKRVAIRQFFQRFLGALRTDLEQAGCDFDRLPQWLTAAEVRIGVTGQTAIAVFDESTRGRDSFDFRGKVLADTVLLLEGPDFVPSGLALPTPGELVIARQLSGEDSGVRSQAPTIQLLEGTALHKAFTTTEYHGPITLIEFFLQRLRPAGLSASQLIPLALLVHLARRR